MKIFFFILLLPLFGAIYLFLHFTYGDAQGNGGWQGMWDKTLRWKILAAVLSIVYFPLTWFMSYFGPKWEKLLD